MQNTLKRNPSLAVEGPLKNYFLIIQKELVRVKEKKFVLEKQTAILQ